MRVLILGVNGFIGRSIAHQLRATGITTFGLGRSKFQDSDEFYVQGDRSNLKQIRQVVQERKTNVIVDVIPMVAANTLPLLDCLQGEIDRYVMISSSDVYANYELLHRRSSGQAKQNAADENSPLRSTRYPYRQTKLRADEAPDKHLDDYDKIPIENAVQRLSSPWTILRLPMVYGPGDRQRRFSWAIKPMLDNEDKLVIPRAWANWQSTYGYIENVGAAIAASIESNRACNEIFNVAESSPVSHLEWAKRFAEVINWQGEIEISDDPNNPFHRRLSGLDLGVPFLIDGSKLRNKLGFADIIDSTTALERTVVSEQAG